MGRATLAQRVAHGNVETNPRLHESPFKNSRDIYHYTKKKNQVAKLQVTLQNKVRGESSVRGESLREQTFSRKGDIPVVDCPQNVFWIGQKHSNKCKLRLFEKSPPPRPPIKCATPDLHPNHRLVPMCSALLLPLPRQLNMTLCFNFSC